MLGKKAWVPCLVPCIASATGEQAVRTRQTWSWSALGGSLHWGSKNVRRQPFNLNAFLPCSHIFEFWRRCQKARKFFLPSGHHIEWAPTVVAVSLNALQWFLISYGKRQSSQSSQKMDMQLKKGWKLYFKDNWVELRCWLFYDKVFQSTVRTSRC